MFYLSHFASFPCLFCNQQVIDRKDHADFFSKKRVCSCNASFKYALLETEMPLMLYGSWQKHIKVENMFAKDKFYFSTGSCLWSAIAWHFQPLKIVPHVSTYYTVWLGWNARFCWFFFLILIYFSNEQVLWLHLLWFSLYFYLKKQKLSSLNPCSLSSPLQRVTIFWRIPNLSDYFFPCLSIV